MVINLSSHPLYTVWDRQDQVDQLNVLLHEVFRQDVLAPQYWMTVTALAKKS